MSTIKVWIPYLRNRANYVSIIDNKIKAARDLTFVLRQFKLL